MNPQPDAASTTTVATTTESGRAAEDTVAAWLEASGWSVLARNWRKGPGELDLVAQKADVLAFIEVKRVDAYGLESLTHSVGSRKRHRIVETAKLFIQAHRQFEGMTQRFDVAAVRKDAVAGYIEAAFMEKR